MSGGRAGDGTIRHHPSDATLLGHAARTLGSTAEIVVEAHLARCPECRAKADLVEEVGGLLLEDLSPAPLASDALERMMSRLQEVGGPEPPGDPHPAEPSVGLRELLQAARPRWVAPGVWHAVLLRERDEPGEVLRLVRIRPGTALPRHDHRGVELTLVLEGTFTDEAGSYGPGDLAEVAEGAAHRPIAGGPEDCVCLLATQGRLRFQGLLTRLFGALRGV